MSMSNAAKTLEMVTLNTARGAYSVAVYETASLGWAANYGALETYNNPSRAAALASLKLSLEICRPACSPNSALGFARTLRAAERGQAY
jgi:hypothetical protein